jgi:DNA-binding HxlR family transcriptional regulator
LNLVLKRNPIRYTAVMARKRFDDSNCSVARALDEVGDWWSLLVVLHAMYGTRRFVDFQKELGIARNILCDRLARLVDNQVLKKVEAGEHGSRFEYRLTEKGRDLFPIVVALRQWGDKWNPAPEQPTLDLRDRETLRSIRPVAVQDADGKPLTVRDVFVLDDEREQALALKASAPVPQSGSN